MLDNPHCFVVRLKLLKPPTDSLVPRLPSPGYVRWREAWLNSRHVVWKPFCLIDYIEFADYM